MRKKPPKNRARLFDEGGMISRQISLDPSHSASPTPVPTQLAPVAAVLVTVLCFLLISPRQTDGQTERRHGRNLGRWLGHVVFEERRFLRGTLITQKHGKTKPERSSRLKSALPGGGGGGGGETLQRLQRGRAGAGLPSVDMRQGAASTAAR